MSLEYVQLAPDWLARQIAEVRAEKANWPAAFRDDHHHHDGAATMSEVLNPNVIDPPGFDVNAGWKQCKEDVDDFRKAGREIAAAFCADPGICSCPACGQMHWAWGNRQRCLKCEFEYPTDAWAMYSWGVQAAWRTGGDATKIEFNCDRKRLSHPYFRYGFENPINRAAYDAQKETVERRGKTYDIQRVDLHDIFKLIDWRSIMSAPPDHAADWIAPLAEQLVTSLRGNGGNANTYEANVAWTAAMISSRAPDGYGELIKRLAVAAEEAGAALLDAAHSLLDAERNQQAGRCSIAASKLSAAIAQLPPELRGNP